MQSFNEGNKYYNLKDYEKAIDLYKKSIENNENTACSHIIIVEYALLN